MKNWVKFLNENLNTQNKRIWRNRFEYKGESYRLGSWMYIYRFSDGGSKFATVNREEANGVSGVGVAGIIIELDKIKWLDSQTHFDDDFIRSKEIINQKTIQKEKHLYNILKSLPPNLSEKIYDEITIEISLLSIFEPENLETFLEPENLELFINQLKYNL